MWAAARLSFDGYAAAPFAGHFSVDAATLLAKALVLALALPVLLMSRDEFDGVEFPVLLLSSLYGVGLMLSADSFLTLFLGLEIMSLPVYVLVLLAYQRPQSAEAALKYLVLGGTSTAMFLMGVSLLYGGTGSMDIAVFARALGSADAMARAAVVLVILAFFLKAAIVPFHAWAPDAYEGASVPVTAYMAVVVKAGVLLAAVRLFGPATLASPLLELVAVLPLASIVWGNLAAMRQPSLRRMVAYSSIAHAGYLFYALLGAPEGRMQAVTFYLLAYGAAEPAGLRRAAAGRRRPRARPARQPEGAVPPLALCRADDRHRHAVAGGHTALPRLRRQVPDLQERRRRRPHHLCGARPGGQLPGHLLLPARAAVHVHVRGRAGRGCSRCAAMRWAQA